MTSRLLIATIAGAMIAAGAGVASAQILDKAKRDEIIQVPKSDPHMDAAFQKARASRADFLAIARAPRKSIESMAIKVAVRENNTVEYFWISPFMEKDGRFHGRLNNTPRLVRNVKNGQIISFEESEIVDWLYRENGRMFGNFTACALLKHEPKQAEAFRKEYGLVCD